MLSHSKTPKTQQVEGFTQARKKNMIILVAVNGDGMFVPAKYFTYLGYFAKKYPVPVKSTIS